MTDHKTRPRWVCETLWNPWYNRITQQIVGFCRLPLRSQLINCEVPLRSIQKIFQVRRSKNTKLPIHKIHKSYHNLRVILEISSDLPSCFVAALPKFRWSNARSLRCLKTSKSWQRLQRFHSMGNRCNEFYVYYIYIHNNIYMIYVYIIYNVEIGLINLIW